MGRGDHIAIVAIVTAVVPNVNTNAWNQVRDEGPYAMDPPSFAELVSRARCGDPDAIRRLVEQYEPAIRRQVRFTLMDNKLRRVLEETDICQSVMGQFFNGLVHGPVRAGRAREAGRAVEAMVKNKITDQARYWRAGRRDYLRNVTPSDSEGPVDPMSSEPTPSRIVEDSDYLAEFESRLSDWERTIFAFRRQGMSWTEIGDRTGGRRKRSGSASNEPSIESGAPRPRRVTSREAATPDDR